MSEFEFGWLGQHLIRGAVFLALVWGAWVFVRRGHGRYAFWRGVFVILLAMGITGIGPGLRFVEIGFETWKPEKSTLAPVASESPAMNMAPLSEERVALISPAAAEPVRIGFALFGIWLAGVCLGSIRLMTSWIAVQNLARRATPLKFREATVLGTESISTPVTFGIFRPRILVPIGFAEWPEEDRKIAIRHELAHLRHRDGLWQLLGAVTAVLHWPNPLVWLALRQMERDRELNADAQVVRSGVSPQCYCDLLVRLASSTPTPMAALPMARRSTIPMRVDRILRNDAGKAALGPLLWIALGLLAGVGLTIGVTSIIEPKEGKKPIEVTTRFVEVAPPPSIKGSSEPDENGYYTEVFRVPSNFARDEERPAKARAILEDLGVVFPEGATAVHNAKQRQLIVRNTEDNIAMTRAALEGYFVELERTMKQIYITTKIVTTPNEISGIDWFAGTSDVAVAGVFTDPQYQMIIRALNQTKDVDLLSVPSVLAKNENRASVELDGVGMIDVTPTIGADEYTIDLSFHAIYGNSKINTQITIWDGQTVALSSPEKDGKVTITFVTARLVDPAGIQISKPPSDQPE